MNYSDDALSQLMKKHSELLSRYSDLIISVMSFSQSLKRDRAREFLVHGVCRRLMILYTCIINIFQLFPPDQDKPLIEKNRIDVEINLHTFLINIYGTLENLALSAGYEYEIIGKKSEGKISIRQANLFRIEFRKRLRDPLNTYLSQSRIIDWYKQYSKNYRDALAHRIPPYVPPSALNDEEQQRSQAIEKKIASIYPTHNFNQIEDLRQEQAALGRANPLFIHSFSERAKPLYLHAQILADFSTIEELVEVFIGSEKGISGSFGSEFGTSIHI